MDIVVSVPLVSVYRMYMPTVDDGKVHELSIGTILQCCRSLSNSWLNSLILLAAPLPTVLGYTLYTVSFKRIVSIRFRDSSYHTCYS